MEGGAERDREWSYQRLLEVRDQKISKTQFLRHVHHAGRVKKVNIRLLGYKRWGGRGRGGVSAHQIIRGQKVVIWPIGHMTGSRSLANCVNDPIEGQPHKTKIR